jgi:1,2-diacylglycerol 3-alpha-glucosyltransferase
MKLGILVLSIGSFGSKGFYNLQEIGLAKALDQLCDEVKIYKLVPKEAQGRTENIDGTMHATVQFIPSKAVGTNGIPNMKLVDKNLDALICFSDTQIFFPNVYNWAKRNHVKLLPYIGVAESHSTSALKSKCIDWLFSRNVRAYQKCACLAKTPAVEKKLRSNGVKNITVAPVGLDLTLMKADYEAYSPTELKKKYSYQATDKVLLFIGRLIDEKQPIRMIEIFAELVKRDEAYKLLMVGSGELKTAVEAKIQELGLMTQVQMLERIPNSDIWELYCFAEAFVNLNQQEIFGMAILEAMYYGCKVVAWHAPGPDLIIENGVSGYLVNNNSQIIEILKSNKDNRLQAHDRIVNEFTWNSTAEKIKMQVGRKYLTNNDSCILEIT